MNHDNKKDPFEKGLELGYTLAYKNPIVLNILIALFDRKPDLQRGLIKGKEAFEKDQKILSVDQWKRQERLAQLKKNNGQEQDKDDLER